MLILPKLFVSIIWVVSSNQQFIKIDPIGETAQQRTSEVFAFEEAHNYEGLEKHATSWLEKHPNDFGAWRILGIAQANQHKTEEAIKSIKRSIELQPEFKQAWYTLGEIYKHDHDNKNGMECYHQLMKLDAVMARRFLRNVYGIW